MATIPEVFAIAIQHHQGGRLEAAAQIYQQILTADPNHANAIHLFGVVALQTGKHEIAAEYIERAIGLKGNVAEFHSNLGEARRALGNLAGAVACYRRALELKPDSAEIQCNLGNTLKRMGKPDEAVACYRRALELKPGFAELHNNLGVTLKEQGKLDEAIACYRRASELKPNFAELHNNLGVALKEQGNLDEAIACYRRALELKPGYAEAENNLGLAFKEQRKLDDAVAAYRRALALKPDYAEAHNNLGAALNEQGKLDEAADFCRRALELKPDYAEAHNNLGVVLKNQGNTVEAIACYRRALRLKPDWAETEINFAVALTEQGKLDEAAACCRHTLELKPDYAEAHINLGNVLKEQGKPDEAVESYRCALALKPDDAGVHGALGGVLEETGDLRGAEDSYRAALRHDPQFAAAHLKLATLLGGRLSPEDFAAQRRLLDDGCDSDEQRLFLHFGLAHVLDGRGEYAEAAEHLARGNAMQLALRRKLGQEYDPEEHRSLVDRMIEICSTEFFARLRGFGLQSEIPVFVIGLPRSGTTLIEQVLAGHSQVFGAGEIPFVHDTMVALGGYGANFVEGLRRLDKETTRHFASQHLERLRALKPEALRIVNKMPENYLSLGPLATLFPQAKFIHCRRDLRDVAVSCWMTQFRELRWANDQQHIASRFHQYRRIMEHWGKVLPVSVLEVDYEETVADLEGTARRLVNWCGLEWEAGCLEFHRLARPVRTASAIQVRQPVYRTSVERWRHYQESLAALFDAISAEPGK